MAKPFDDYRFHFYTGGIDRKRPQEVINLQELIDKVRGPYYERAVDQIREQTSKEKKKELKDKLDYVTISGTFNPFRNAKNLYQHSGLMVLDFDDDIVDLASARLQLESDPHCLVSFESPSGGRLKCIYEIAQPNRHLEAFADISEYVKQTYGYPLDASGSDVSRPCFLSHDKAVYVNPNAEPYEIRGLVLKAAKAKPITDQQVIRNATATYKHVRAVVERIEQQQIDISGGPGGYRQRLLLAFSMKTLGEDGRGLLHRILQFYANYTPEETDEKFDNALANSWFTTPAKFFSIAKDYGIDIAKPGTKPKEPTPIAPSDTPDGPMPVSEAVMFDAQPEAQEEGDKEKKSKRNWYANVNYRDGGIWIWGTKNWICVAENFQIFVKYCTEDENEEKTWILEVLVADRPDPLYIEISHDEFCSATKLKNKLAGYRLALKLTDAYLGELWQHLFKMNFPEAIKVMRLGYHAASKVFFFSNKAVNGQVLEPDEFGIVTVINPNGSSFCLSMPVVKKKRSHLFTLSEGTMTFNEWFSWLARIHKYENAVIPACFYLMSLFRDVVVKHTNASPILYLKGGASSGKSSIARSLCRLYNLHEAVANLKNKNTEAGLVRVMSQTANSVIWMDEYHNDFPFEGLLQSAYDDNGYIRAEENSSHGTDTVDIFSALALTSNYIPENPIFFTRCVFVPIIEQQKTDEQVEAFARFRDVEQEGLSCVTLELLQHRQLIEDGMKQANDDLYAALKEAVKQEKVVERLISNMARVLAPAYILQLFEKINLHFEVVDDDNEILAQFVEIGSKAILRQHTIQTEKTALSEFFELMQNQYENGGIQEGIHFRFDNDLILLRFPSFYTIYAQRYRSQFWKAPADRDTLKSEMVAFEGSDDGDNFFKNIRFLPDEGDDTHRQTKSVSGCCAMTYSKLVDSFGIDWKGRRLDKAGG